MLNSILKLIVCKILHVVDIWRYSLIIYV